MANDPFSLLGESECFTCYAVSAGEAMQLVLLVRILTALNPMADTSPATLMAQGSCYACFGAMTSFQTMKLALLAQISLAHNAANQTDPQSLVTEGKCFPCFGNVDLGALMELALLAQIAA